MHKSWLFFLGFSLLSIFVQGLFSLFEMACISFNRVRLHYFASLGKRRAVWLSELISHPASLFGTTLIGVNASLQFGSEFARRFYESLNLSPDFAPISQVILVVLFGELIPLFGARRHPESIAMSLAPFMILISRILIPLIWAFSMLAKGAQRLAGKPEGVSLFMSREEVTTAFEEGEAAQNEFNALASRVFRIKNSLALQSATPITASQLVSSSATIEEVRHQMSIRFVPFFLIYHRYNQNIIAIATLRDLLHLDPKRKILDVARPPWFVTSDHSLLQILEQFRRNNQTVAVVLDAGGETIGTVTFDQILGLIFGPQGPQSTEEKGKLYVRRTVMGTLGVDQFNLEFQADFPHEEEDTLSDMIVKALGHPPVKGESVEIGDFEFTVLEPSLRGAKLISVKTAD